MRYLLTEFKDKNDRNVYAKESCNVCHGTGRKSSLEKCLCTKLIKNDENMKVVDVRRR